MHHSFPIGLLRSYTYTYAYQFIYLIYTPPFCLKEILKAANSRVYKHTKVKISQIKPIYTIKTLFS